MRTRIAFPHEPSTRRAPAGKGIPGWYVDVAGNTVVVLASLRGQRLVRQRRLTHPPSIRPEDPGRSSTSSAANARSPDPPTCRVRQHQRLALRHDQARNASVTYRGTVTGLIRTNVCVSRATRRTAASGIQAQGASGVGNCGDPVATLSTLHLQSGTAARGPWSPLGFPGATPNPSATVRPPLPVSVGVQRSGTYTLTR